MRVRRLVFVSFAALSFLPAVAQHNIYEYYISGSSSQFIESTGQEADLTLFYAPLEGGADIFTRMSEFNFSAVRYSRRGFDLPMERVYLGDAELSGRITGRMDYTLFSVLRRSKMPKSVIGGSGAAENAPGLAGGVESFIPDPRMMPEERRTATLSYRSNGGVRAGFFGTAQPNSRYSLAYNLTAGAGNDRFMHDLASQEYSASVLQKYEFNARNSLTAGIFGAFSKKDLRSSATKEAFELIGDNYYDPSWGILNGDKVHSRKRYDAPLLVYAGYVGRLTDATEMKATLSYRAGESGYSALAWFDAETPYPDYYRYMPSYYGDTRIGEFLRGKWRAGDPNVTQIDWERMCEVNSYAGQQPVEEGGARYFIEDRVERSSHMQAVASFRTKIDERSHVAYGLRLRSDDVRYFKRVGDMLGGAPFINADQYLADTVRYAGKWLNDVRDPDRKVGDGDRFGYDYRLSMRQYGFYGQYAYAKDNFMLGVTAEIGGAAAKRIGYYEKELHPGDASYGDSKTIKIDTYTAKLAAGYSFSPKHVVRLTGLAAGTAPIVAGMFVSPQSANMTIDNPRAVSVISGEAEYMMTLNRFMCKAVGFYTATSHESDVYSYYDDIESVYSDMVLSGISKAFYGVELGARYDFTPRLALSAAAAAGKYEYASDPSVMIYNDALLTSYVENEHTYLTGYHIGNTPELAASAELKYNIYGFIASLTFNYMGMRYVTANPLRRMERAYLLTDSPERFREFVAQEKLPDAVTVDLFIMKTFDIGNNALTVILSVNNLLNRKDIVYSGYEQMRIMRYGTGLNQRYVPFASKYLYSYPRSFYLSTTYRF